MATFATTAPPDTSRISDARNDSVRFETRLRRARLGLFVGVTGIVMIFISFTSAYVVRQGLPSLDPRTGTLVHDWLPVRLPALLFVNTLVLLISSLTVEFARRQAREAALLRVAMASDGSRAKRDQISWLALTVVLGLTFLIGQWVAWRELAASGFYLATSPSSSFLYLLTGTHGLHLLGGVLALLFAGAASLLRPSVETRAVWADITGWYWHFMAILWVSIFCLLEFAR